mmetsp:Transcript_27617/g.47607  ORF Transcript_27617/g.47607 Transcript_27617/m.47607 type:complete len:118 (-) Transcript_27617:71-424(-)
MEWCLYSLGAGRTVYHGNRGGGNDDEKSAAIFFFFSHKLCLHSMQLWCSLPSNMAAVQKQCRSSAVLQFSAIFLLSDFVVVHVSLLLVLFYTYVAWWFCCFVFILWSSFFFLLGLEK